MSEPKTIKSPLPGTFHRRPSPDAAPYASEGDEISPGDTIGVIEIMKTFYEVKAEEGGIVHRFLVDNEEAVETEQDILTLRRLSSR